LCVRASILSPYERKIVVDSLADFSTFEFEHDDKTRTVYRRGSGPAVVVMHEIPGITPEVARFSRYVSDAGMTVFMPHLFGVPGKAATPSYVWKELARACISHEFRLFAENRSSPIVDWLRALARHAFAELGGKGVGAVGMCITGNFALTMMLDPCLLAPVLAQPSLPLKLPLENRRPAAVHASPEAIANAARRCADERLKVLGLRFVGDPLCKADRFATLERELKGGFEAIELPDSTADPQASKPPHSVLTTHMIDREGEPTKAALNRVLAFLRERLI
jgi:dienelactone hydrolase